MSKQKENYKQYCAEKEHDPYEFWYRNEDIYSDYMSDTICYVPKVQMHLADPIDLVEIIDSIDLPAHRLTGKVRYQYLNYLENLLERNYETWSNTVDSFDNVTFTPSEIKRCAESIEMKAVKSCMIVSLYRNYILKIIAQIRKETNGLNLHSHLINMKFTPMTIKKELCSVAVQTEILELQNSESSNMEVNDELPLLDLPTMSLDEKIRDFEKNLQLNGSNKLSCKYRRKDQMKKTKKKDERRSTIADRIARRKSKLAAPNEEKLHHLSEDVEPVASSSIRQSIPTAVATKRDYGDDKIMRELEAMFETEDDGNIFDTCENQVQIKAIINEIEQFDPPKLDERCKKTTVCDVTVNEHLLSQRLEHHINDKPRLTVSYKPLDDIEATDLKKSMWPCELHMQKMKLRNILSNIADKNYLRYERIHARFLVLFGDSDQEEDELGPYSPSIELDDVLLGSCRHRIAKWVVQALMKPLNDGIIGNRFLFKKLAKHIADNIIFQNQYPDQQFIKNFVLDYFCAHRAVFSIEDMM